MDRRCRVRIQQLFRIRLKKGCMDQDACRYGGGAGSGDTGNPGLVLLEI